MIEDNLRALLRDIDWDHILGLIDIPEAEYPLSVPEREKLAMLRSQIERLIEQLAAYEDWRSQPEL